MRWKGALKTPVYPPDASNLIYCQRSHYTQLVSHKQIQHGPRRERRLGREVPGREADPAAELRGGAAGEREVDGELEAQEELPHVLPEDPGLPDERRVRQVPPDLQRDRHVRDVHPDVRVAELTLDIRTSLFRLCLFPSILRQMEETKKKGNVRGFNLLVFLKELYSDSLKLIDHL
ncbi:unnamed protein product [Pleuronectes platessa]|uniref:Uncharacterized protein n=1 Tax=Pleuronectes platessa TaxID=8262 RepID=A0A9N7ZD21_PLEPL|nr:unnamed protein product [Pleuronectes platessa]